MRWVPSEYKTGDDPSRGVSSFVEKIQDSNHITTASHPSQEGPCVIIPTDTTSSIQFSSPMTSNTQNDKSCTSFSLCVGAPTGIGKDQNDSPGARSQEHDTSSASRLGPDHENDGSRDSTDVHLGTSDWRAEKKDQRGVKRPRSAKI